MAKIPLSIIRPLFKMQGFNLDDVDELEAATDLARSLIRKSSRDYRATVKWLENFTGGESVEACSWWGRGYVVFSSYALRDVDGDAISSEAYDDEGTECGHCGGLHSLDRGAWLESEGASICERCLEQHYETCSECGVVFCRDTMHESNRGDICRRCAESYVYVDATDSYVHADDYESDEHEDTGPILDYCADVLDTCSGFLTHENDAVERLPLFLGVELEVECHGRGSLGDVAQAALDALNADGGFAIAKDDGSLSSGFELVSVPATLRVHRERWKTLFAAGLDLHPCDRAGAATAGLHVHIDRRAFQGAGHIARFERFFNAPANFEFVFAVSGRATRDNLVKWAAPKREKRPTHSLAKSGATRGVVKAREISHRLGYHDEKYSAVNVVKRQTIELRIFRSAADSESRLFECLEIAVAAFEFTASAGYSDASLSSLRFAAWLLEDENARRLPAAADLVRRLVVLGRI